MAKATETAKADPRQAAWEAFLARAEAQAKANGTLAIFEDQKARGEFDAIPPLFTA